MVKLCPNWTIPPYQDQNNRHPPKCQSLILNPKYLDQEYPDWQNWLEKLKDISETKKYLSDFEGKLKELKSSEYKSYFSDESEFKGDLRKDSGRRSYKDLDVRILQFIFDRVKVTDPLKLNEIYSHAKKIKQLKRDGQDYESVKQELQKAIADSQLFDGLKTKPDFDTDDLFKENSFLHLVCKYYKLRQKAKDGRLFIHPEYKFVKGRGYENTGRFDNKRCLLTYCNHKPRQKHYQLLYDLAGVLQVDPEYLREVIKSKGSDTDEKCLIDWLKNDKFKGLKTYTEKASKAQKDYRGELKSLMNDAVNKKSGDLYKLHKKINELSNKIGESLFGTVDEVDEDAKKSFDQKIQKFNSVFSFAQINNIAFKERGGNAKTCAVCSLDNAHRMTQVSLSTNEKETTAKAQRLPAIETRLIDGAVMRMARIVSDAIAKDQWKKIENDLAQDYRVHIPIITESNRFEFEPSLTNLKGNDKKQDKKNKKDKKLKTQEDIYQSKEERIKDANQKKCPYTGNSLDDSGEIDHIIPRASQYGTLNDEANLI